MVGVSSTSLGDVSSLGGGSFILGDLLLEAFLGDDSYSRGVRGLSERVVLGRLGVGLSVTLLGVAARGFLGPPIREEMISMSSSICKEKVVVLREAKLLLRWEGLSDDKVSVETLQGDCSGDEDVSSTIITLKLFTSHKSTVAL